MMRSVATIARSLISKLAPGWVYSGRGGILDQLMGSVAEIIAEAEAGASRVMDELDPRHAWTLLEDFERVLGPDPCGRDLNDLSVTERQLIAFQRWTAYGGQDIPYMVDVARRLGETIEIFEYWPSKSAGLRAGQRVIPEGEQFVYLIRLRPETNVIKFRSAASAAGDRLGRFTLSAAECELRRIRPAHTGIVFQYVTPLFLDAEPLLLDGAELVLS